MLIRSALVLFATLGLATVSQASITPEVERKIKSELLLYVLPDMQRDFVKVQSIEIEERGTGSERRLFGTITYTTLKASRVPNCLGYQEELLVTGERPSEGWAGSWHCGEGE